jgi:hypothetical protein
MPTQKAMDFFVNLRYDRSLRKKMNLMSPEQVNPYLQTIGYAFTLEQLEEAVNYYKLRCPSEQSALEIDEIKYWYCFLTAVNPQQTYNISG